jgi:hypothetical protein
MPAVIVTLFEGHYAVGGGALINSLYANGFRGRFYVGYRGKLQGWASGAVKNDGYLSLHPAEGLEVRFLEVPPGWHMNYLKPDFMMRVWDQFEPDAESIFYFDPDIVIKCRWTFFEEWVGYGVALCQEVVWAQLPSDHPFRIAMGRWAEAHGFPPVSRLVDAALNGGFIGVRREQRDALELWHRLISAVSETQSLEKFCVPWDRTQPFCIADQDSLNLLAGIYPGQLSRVGPDGMDFVPGGFIMSHAAGLYKPWKKPFVRNALVGVPPTLADKGWAANLAQPIEVYDKAKRARLRREIRLASAIGRFVRKA